MLDREEFDRWREEAGRALEAARVQAAAGLHNWACFAAEQAAQLAVKAVLHGMGQAPWGHDLVKLGSSLKETAGPGWVSSLDPFMRRLSRHYIPARYPDAHPAGPPGLHYGVEDSTEAIGDAQAIIEGVDSMWVSLSRKQPNGE